jgi:hypothetical protein
MYQVEKESSFAHERAGRLRCDKGLFKPSRRAQRCKPRCPSILPFCPFAHGEQFICPLLVRLSRPACPMPVVAFCQKPRFIRRVDSPKLSPLPHSRDQQIPQLLNADNVSALFGLNKLLPASLYSRNSGADHGSENHSTFQNPHPLPTLTYLNPYRFALPFFHIPPSSITSRPSHHCFPQASLLCTISTPIGRCVAHIRP